MTETQMKKRHGVYAVCAFLLGVVTIALLVFVRDESLWGLTLIVGLLFYSREMYWSGRLTAVRLTVAEREAIANTGYAEGWADAFEDVRQNGLR